MRIIRLVLSILAAIYVVPRLVMLVRTLVQDVGRYNDIRAMSNEKPLIAEVPEMARDIVAGELAAMKDAASSFESLPEDAARYMRIKSM